MFSAVKFSKKIIPYVKEEKTKVAVAIFFSFVLAFLKGLQAYLVKPIFDKGLTPTSTLEDNLILVGQLILIVVVNFPARFFHFYWIRFVVDQATCQIRSQMYRKLQHIPLSFFSESKQGELVSSLLNDTLTFSHGFRAVIDLIREPITALVMLGLAFSRDWQLTLVIFAAAPLFILIFNRSGFLVRNQQQVVQEKIAQMTHVVSEGVMGQKISKAFNLQNYVRERFDQSQKKFFDAQMKTAKTEEIAHPMVEFVGGLAFAGIVLFAHYRIHSGGMTTGDFVSFITAMALFMDPIRKYSQANVKLNQARAAGDRIFKLLEEKEEPDSGRMAIDEFRGEIKVQNLSFSYTGEYPVINQVNMDIKAGQKIAFVGLSGSGKSTLINLLLGLYSIPNDMISIQGIDINQFEKKSLRNLFSLVGQDIFLFNDTILENLCVGNNYSSEEIEKALDVAYANEFIRRLPEGLNTNIGDGGLKLSGGQRQRLTIARAFLRKSPILLFDEATSALDNESEKMVQRALDQLGQNKTVIAVAHRLTTIQDFDQIYVFDEGKIVEFGTHDELMVKNGSYFKLYELSKKVGTNA